jgi:MFS family permease
MLSLGILVNRVGGYVTIYLALILAEKRVAVWEIGLALTFSACSGIAGSALGGVCTSWLGSRWTIFTAMLGSAVFTALFALPLPYPVTVAVICWISLFNRAYVPAAATTVGRLAPPGQRVPMFAYLQFAFNVGAAIGPLAGGFLLTRSLTALLLIDASTSACFALLGLRVPAEGRRRLRRAGRPAKRIRDDRRYLAFCVAFLLMFMAYGQSSGALPLSMKAHHYSLEFIGLLLSMNAVAVILFQLPLSVFTRRLPVWLPLTGGAVCICGGYALLAAGLSLPLIIANVTLWTAGEMISTPIGPAVAATMSTEETQGIYQGAFTLARATGQIVGPAAGVFLFSAGPSLPWLGCAVLGVISAALFFSFPRAISMHAPPAPGREKAGHQA